MGKAKPPARLSRTEGLPDRWADVRPTGNKVPSKRYQALMNQVDFELGAIAFHCLKVYQAMGKNYYSSYRPIDMIFQTDVFFNFVETNYFVFKEQDGASLSQAYDMYKNYCDEALVDFKLPRHKFREELKSYFREFQEYSRVDGKQVRSYYEGFLASKFKNLAAQTTEEHQYSLVLDATESLLDTMLADCPAQYSTESGVPERKWNKIETRLSDLDTRRHGPRRARHVRKCCGS